ncbi:MULTISPECIES: RDD family protein [Clostridium]|uniref:RDD family protein n=1 Tax=Clostridium TaxID=1485 RepID=UPI002152E8A7|nr:RDD family protein [Clostridium sp. LY3-2]MCR6515735.1 RDD family protein [Clostridium sp. LY3-2]
MSNKEEIENVKDEVKEDVVVVEETTNEDIDSFLEDEEIKEESKEINNELQTLENEKFVEVDNNPSFFKKLFANLLDQALVLGVSAIFLLVFDFVIGFFGFMVVNPSPVLLIIYVIFNVLYYPLIERKGNRSVGKRILSIR